jgi:tetratricopeptide (TPR) repeat protein
MTRNINNLIDTPRGLGRALACLVVLLIGSSAYAQDDAAQAPTTIQWRATDTAGNPVAVPETGSISVVLFVKAGQDRSGEAMQQVRKLLTETPGAVGGADLQVVAVVSGHDAGVGAAKLKDSGKCPWPIVVDTDYQASGLMSVRVWPSTVIVDEQGNRIARMPGLRESYTKDLRAYLDFARGQIDKTELRQRLKTHSTVASTPGRVASRHLHLAEKLLEKGRTDLAREELQLGLVSSPDDAPLQLTLARVHMMVGQPAEAMAILDKLDTDAVAVWRVQTLRGRALVALKRFDEARAALVEALKINPDPAQAYYFMGRVHEQAGEWDQASQAYRNAFEKSTASQGLGAGETSHDR